MSPSLKRDVTQMPGPRPINAPPERPHHERTKLQLFSKGGKGGPGNPCSKQVNRFRIAIINAVTADDVRDIIKELVRQAKGGYLPAIKELLNRLIGKAPAFDTLHVIEQVHNNDGTTLTPDQMVMAMDASISGEVDMKKTPPKPGAGSARTTTRPGLS